MVIQAISVAILVFVIIFQAWQAVQRQKTFDARERDLLDRVMARNYETFVQSEAVREQMNASPSSQAYEEERGIPVI